MANLQVKNLPEPLHRELRQCAARRGLTLRDLIVVAVERELAREKFLARLGGRAPVALGQPAARLLEEARRERDGHAAR